MNLHPREQERERLDREMEAAEREFDWARFAPKGGGLVVWRDWTVERTTKPEVTNE